MKKVIVVQATENQPEFILILTLLATVDQMSFSNTNNIIGKGVIIHAGTDDLMSQLTGTAGARVSCGVITERLG